MSRFGTSRHFVALQVLNAIEAIADAAEPQKLAGAFSTLALMLVYASDHIRLGCAYVAPVGIVPFACLLCRRERREVPEVERPRPSAPTTHNKDRREAADGAGTGGIVDEVRKISDLRLLTLQASHVFPHKRRRVHGCMIAAGRAIRLEGPPNREPACAVGRGGP